MSKAPPIPPQQRAGHGADSPVPRDDARAPRDSAAGRQGVDPDKQGQAGNTNINTHHQGHQQDR